MPPAFHRTNRLNPTAPRDAEAAVRAGVSRSDAFTLGARQFTLPPPFIAPAVAG